MKLSFHIPNDPELKKVIQEKEREANLSISKFLFVFAISNLISWILLYTKIVASTYLWANVTLLGSAVVCSLAAIFCFKKKGKGKYIKYLLIGALSIATFLINIISGYKFWLLYALPIISSCRYFNFKFTTIIYFLSDLFLILTAYVDAYLYELTGFLDLNTVYFEQKKQVELSGYLVDTIVNIKPDSFSLLMSELHITILTNIIIFTVVYIFSIGLLRHTRSILVEVNKINKQKTDMELEVANSRSRIMLSQIQPHFLYNAISAIMAIDGNPDETIDALGDFGKYLRENLDVITSGDMVPFQKELQHVMRYVSLEELRFGDKIKVNYDIQTDTFSIPALTVQMLVENAIKHGISKKPDGGNVNVQTKETIDEYTIIVEDNGLGFDPTKGKPQDGRSHVGLENIESRLKNLCDGTMEIDSTIGNGTIAIVHIPKEKNQ